MTPDTDDRTRILRNLNLIDKALRQFLPIQTRPVFIIEPTVYEDPVYTHEFPDVEPERLIGETFSDYVAAPAPVEALQGMEDSYKDCAPDWIWLRSWSERHPTHSTVDFTASSINVDFRTWRVDMEAGG